MTSTSRKQKVSKVASRALLVVSVPLAAAIAIGYAADYHWLIELVASFRAPLTFGLLLLLVIETLCWRRWPLLIVLFSCAAIGVASASRFYLDPPHGRTAAEGASPLRIVFANRGGSTEGLAPGFGDDADLVFLSEVPPQSLVRMREDPLAYGGWGLLRYEKHRLAYYDVDRGTKGIAILSRYPIDDVEPTLLAGGASAVEVRLRVDGKPWRVVAVHLQSPKSPEFLRLRNTNLAWAAERSRQAQAAGESVVVIGDFNTSPFSPAFDRLVKAGELQDSMIGRGHQSSWPSLSSSRVTSWWASLIGHDLWPTAFGVAIDHALHSPDVVTTYREVGRSNGSDHLPVLVELRLREVEGRDSSRP